MAGKRDIYSWGDSTTLLIVFSPYFVSFEFQITFFLLKLNGTQTKFAYFNLTNIPHKPRSENLCRRKLCSC